MFKERLRELLPLYLVTDISEYEGMSALHIVREALRGGVTMVQLREKKARLRETLREGAAIRELCREYGVPFLVNDRVDVAMLLDADGVHVGQDDMPAREVRKLLGPDKIVGVSAGTMEEAEWAMEQGADYLGVGAVYATLSKGDAGEPIGTALIAQIKQRWPGVCMVGIGGIQAHNSAAVIAAGADGVAVISAIARQKDPKQAAERLLAQVKRRD